MTTSIGVTILGATGSIGVSTLDVLARHPTDYHVVALTANTNVSRLHQQCLKYKPKYAVMANADAAEQLDQCLKGEGIEVLSGVEGLQQVASLEQTDYVMAAIVGAAGLLPTLAAARAGKRVLLANKEALVMTGNLFMQAIAEHQAELLPIDSEHNAVFQCMPTNENARQSAVKQIWLTASGGPFRTRPIHELVNVTPSEACAHPNWDMGRKISVDSATMMNKGLEVIEACWLFAVPADQITVVLHPQSVIHSMVEYIDGSVLAQLGNPDMRTPIAHALAWPQRMTSGVARLDLFQVAKLEFSEPDRLRFPCLDLAYQSICAGGTTPAILNAANEVAVQAFLDEKLAFTDIPKLVEATLGAITPNEPNSVEVILKDDQQARIYAEQAIGQAIGVQ